jgi:hypothetical protein
MLRLQIPLNCIQTVSILRIFSLINLKYIHFKGSGISGLSDFFD